MWITFQTEDAEQPSQEWAQFFLETLFSNINDDGSYGVPMYTFTSDTSDFTCVPTIDETN